MNFFYSTIILLTTFLTGSLTCVSQKKAAIVPFEVLSTTYYSWVAGESEKGTTVEIHLANVASEVQFDSIVFRKMKVPVRMAQNTGERKTLTAVFPSGESRLQVETQGSSQHNQLIYSYKGEKRVQFLKTVSREKMKYYKPLE
jgi:hypothetical protein